jgi:hypothetical protein
VDQKDQLLGLSALVLNLIYLWWLAHNLEHPLGWLLLIVDMVLPC